MPAAEKTAYRKCPSPLACLACFAVDWLGRVRGFATVDICPTEVRLAWLELSCGTRKAGRQEDLLPFVRDAKKHVWFCCGRDTPWRGSGRVRGGRDTPWRELPEDTAKTSRHGVPRPHRAVRLELGAATLPAIRVADSAPKSA